MPPLGGRDGGHCCRDCGYGGCGDRIIVVVVMPVAQGRHPAPACRSPQPHPPQLFGTAAAAAAAAAAARWSERGRLRPAEAADGRRRLRTGGAFLHIYDVFCRPRAEEGVQGEWRPPLSLQGPHARRAGGDRGPNVPHPCHGGETPSASFVPCATTSSQVASGKSSYKWPAGGSGFFAARPRTAWAPCGFGFPRRGGGREERRLFERLAGDGGLAGRTCGGGELNFR